MNTSKPSAVVRKTHIFFDVCVTSNSQKLEITQTETYHHALPLFLGLFLSTSCAISPMAIIPPPQLIFTFCDSDPSQVAIEERGRRDRWAGHMACLNATTNRLCKTWFIHRRVKRRRCFFIAFCSLHGGLPW